MRRLAAAVAGLVLLALLAGGLWIYRSLEQPYRRFTEPEVFVEIPEGSGTASMARRLTEAGVVQNETVFRAAVWAGRAGRRLQAGEYRFDRAASPRRGGGQARPRGRLPAEHHLPGGTHHPPDGRAVRREGLWTGERFLSAASSRDVFRALDPEPPPTSRAICSPTRMRCRGGHRRDARRAHGGRSPQRACPQTFSARAKAAACPSASSSRWPQSSRRRPAPRRSAARRRRLQQPAADRHGPAVRSRR